MFGLLLRGKNHNKRLKAHTLYHPPPEGGMRQTHFPATNRRRKKATTDWHPPPYLGITSSRYVSSMVLAGEHDQKGSSFTRKQTLKKYKVPTDLHWRRLVIPMPNIIKLVEAITEKLRHSAPDGGDNNYCFTRRRRKKATTAYHPPPLIWVSSEKPDLKQNH